MQDDSSSKSLQSEVGPPPRRHLLKRVIVEDVSSKTNDPQGGVSMLFKRETVSMSLSRAPDLGCGASGVNQMSWLAWHDFRGKPAARIRIACTIL